MRFFRDDFQIDGSFHERPQPVVETTTSSPVIGRATTLVMAIGCGVVVATVYSNQPMLGIMEAAFPSQVWRPSGAMRRLNELFSRFRREVTQSC
jgi:hypothetical protein